MRRPEIQVDTVSISNSATGNLTLALPITAVLITSKAVGDLFNEGIYDTHIHLWGVPILEWEPPPNSELIKATGVMSKPVVGFRSGKG